MTGKCRAGDAVRSHWTCWPRFPGRSGRRGQHSPPDGSILRRQDRWWRGVIAWAGSRGPGCGAALAAGPRRSLGLCRGLFGQPLVGAVPAGEPPGGEGRRAVGCWVGTGLDGREGYTFADDEGELGGIPGVVVGNDLLVA